MSSLYVHGKSLFITKIPEHVSMQASDLFTAIHKAIRAMLFTTAAQIQSVDIDNDSEKQELLRMLGENLDFLEEHASNEDNLIFPALGMTISDTLGNVGREHEHLRMLADHVHRLIVELRQTDGDACLDVLTLLRRAFHALVAGHLAHMNHEEETILPATLQHLSDEHVAKIRNTIQQKVPPDRYLRWMRWMLPALQPREFAVLLSGMSMSAPEAQYRHFLDMASGIVGENRLAHVLDLASGS